MINNKNNSTILMTMAVCSLLGKRYVGYLYLCQGTKRAMGVCRLKKNKTQFLIGKIIQKGYVRKGKI